MKYLSSFDKLLWIFFLSIAMLIGFRIFYTQSLMHIFLCWNIFLAWIPYQLSKYFHFSARPARWKQALLFITWLLFFPNALYIVTDIIHMEENKDIPLWYDAFLLFASSFVGIVMAFVSLYKVECFLRSNFPRRLVMLLIPAILFIASFGVYLGRFERWNSWNVISDPLSLAASIMYNFSSPFHNYRTWAITILFTGIYSLLYFFLKMLPKAFIAEQRKHARL